MKRTKHIRRLFALGVLLCLAGAAHAQQHTINFDTDAAGNTIADGTTIAEQYALWGVHFVPNVVLGNNGDDNFADNTGMTATSTDFDPFFVDIAPQQPTGNVLHSLTDYFTEDGDFNFWVKFDQPVFNVSVDTYNSFADVNFSLAFYGLGSDFNPVSFGVADAPFDYYSRVTLDSNAPISYLLVTGSTDFLSYDAWAAVDNLTFTTATSTAAPEPGVGLLFGTGLLPLAVGILRHRRQAKGKPA